MEVYKLVKK